jgi:membrane protease YdiL (CAAX protease family)
MPMLEFLTVFVIAILPQVLTGFYPDEMRAMLNNLPGNWKFITTLPGRLGSILLILFIGSLRQDDFQSIGLNGVQAASFPTLLAAGALSVYLLLILFFASKRSAKSREEMAATRQRVLIGLRYSDTSTPWKRLAAYSDLWIAVIGEELVYRGYLVLLMSRQTGALFPWIAFSLALSILVHLYQGRTWKLALGQMLIAALFIFVVVITDSLMAAIIPHLVYNTVWLSRALKSPPNGAEATPTP